MDQEFENYAEPDQLDRRRWTLLEITGLIAGVMGLVTALAAAVIVVLAAAFALAMRDFN